MSKLKCIYSACIIAFMLLSGFDVFSSMAQGEKIMACYFRGRNFMNFSGDSIDPFLCTHIICASGVVTEDGPRGFLPSDNLMYQQVADLKKRNPQLKVMISLSSGFQSVVDQPFAAVIEKFAIEAVTFLERLNMDGFDLDWEFPHIYEKVAYIKFIQILSKYLHSSELLLSMALPAHPNLLIRGFDLKVINEYVDFVTAMTYDYHTFDKNTDTNTGYNSPLYTPKGEPLFSSTADTITYFIEQGLAKSKILMGIPTYGKSWTLEDPKVHGLHSKAISLGTAAPSSGAVGLFYTQDVCVAQKLGANVVVDKVNVAEYLYNGTQWASFEGNYTVPIKMQWVKDRELAGIGIWAYQEDDIFGICGQGPAPILHLLRDHLHANSSRVSFSIH